jgi:hypothetical protein
VVLTRLMWWYTAAAEECKSAAFPRPSDDPISDNRVGTTYLDDYFGLNTTANNASGYDFVGWAAGQEVGAAEVRSSSCIVTLRPCLTPAAVLMCDTCPLAAHRLRGLGCQPVRLTAYYGTSTKHRGRTRCVRISSSRILVSHSGLASTSGLHPRSTTYCSTCKLHNYTFGRIRGTCSCTRCTVVQQRPLSPPCQGPNPLVHVGQQGRWVHR